MLGRLAVSCSITRRYGVLLLGGLLALNAACAAPSRRVAPPAAVITEDFDPQGLNDDDFLLNPPAGAETTRVDQTGAPAASYVHVDGFRVQIAVVSSAERARVVRNEAEAKLDVTVYVYRDPDTGLHKIHAGNGRTATEVESLRHLAKGQGYPEAFIVRARIELPRAAVYGPDPVFGFRVQVFATSNRAAAAGEMAAHLKDGYVIAEKQSERRELPGAAPYDSLKRVVEVTTYRLTKADREVVCILTYDSQRESIEERCQPAR